MSLLREILVQNTHDAGEIVFSQIANLLSQNQLHNIGLATGSTMLPVYKAWRASTLDFTQVNTFNLDEYLGLGAQHHQSYSYFMHEQLFNHIVFKKHFLLNGQTNTPEQECQQYEQLLNEHPLDLQLLGVGENGHIAFNEPLTAIHSTTQIADLTESTIFANSRFFKKNESVPKQALTMGIQSILNAKKIIIVMMGEKKRAAYQKLMAKKIDPKWPVSYLNQHPDVTIITDLNG